MKYERITAGDIRVGDRVGVSRNTIRQVLDVTRNANSVWLTFNIAQGTYRTRPGLNRKYWREVDELALDEARIADEMEREAVRGISAPDF